MSVKSDNWVKCLGLTFDPNFNLKPYLHELNNEVSRDNFLFDYYQKLDIL